MPRVIEVIEHEHYRGKGTESDPCRVVVQYLDFNGNLLAEAHDPYPTPTTTSPPSQILVSADYKRGAPCS